jgi:hypothetical protein
MENLLAILFQARNVAHVHHWKVKSFSLHLALGELYESLISFADDIAEMYMGRYGTNIDVTSVGPVGFSEQDPLEFIRQLDKCLDDLKSTIPQDGFIVNKYEEIQGIVSQTKYKMENLR